MDEEGEDIRPKIASFLFPEGDNKALSRQIFELVRYGRFSWSDVMNMPITTRRRQHFLLTRYTERDNAASSGKSNLPAIEMEDHISSVAENLKSIEDGVPIKADTKVKGNLPTAVQEALARMEKETSGLIVKQEKVKSLDKEKKSLTIKSPENLLATESIKYEKVMVDNKPKPLVIEGELPKEVEPQTLEEASRKLKYKKVEIPKELLKLMKKKSGQG